MGEYFSNEPPAKIERLARIEGQSNFLSCLAGIEVGPDTTQDAAALGMSRTNGAIPELLEAHVARTEMFKLPLMSVVWHALRRELKPKEADWPWMQGAIADAFCEIRLGTAKPAGSRAKCFKVREETYRTVRNTAYRIFAEILSRAEREWTRARFSEGQITKKAHSSGKGERETTTTWIGRISLLPGIHCATALPASGFDKNDDDAHVTDTRAVGINDRLGWDDRNAAPGPVTTLPAQPTANASGLSPTQEAA